MKIRIQRIFSDKVGHHSLGRDLDKKAEVMDDKEPEERYKREDIRKPLFKRSREEARFENMDEKVEGRPSVVYNGNSYTEKKNHVER